MTLNVNTAALRIGRAVKDAEASIDNALETSASLMLELIQARRDLDGAAHLGQSALIRLNRAQKAILEGSTDVFRVHDELRRVNREVCGPDTGESKPMGALEADEAEAA